VKTTNLPSGSQRVSEVGLRWIEELSGATGTIFVPMQTTIRVRATGVTTVTIAGQLAMTMQADEIAYFNSGTGEPDNKSPKIQIDIGGAAAFVQVAKDNETGRRSR
jgi:uncharacterized membrane protein YdcZ (DUF606 family)